MLGDGGEKINVDYFSSLDGADSGHHQNAAALKYGGFTLSFTKYENSALETLALYKSGAIEHSQVMLTLLSQTNTITNDTTSSFCTLRESGTSTIDRVVAWGGLSIALLSLGPEAAGFFTARTAVMSLEPF